MLAESVHAADEADVLSRSLRHLLMLNFYW